MYAAMCYQACLDGVLAMIDSEDDLKTLLLSQIKGDKKVIDIILKMYNMQDEYSTFNEMK